MLCHKAYVDATRRPYGYLEKRARLRTAPEDEHISRQATDRLCAKVRTLLLLEKRNISHCICAVSSESLQQSYATNVSCLLQPYIPILKMIVCMSEARRHAYLKNCDQDIIDCFSECAKMF